MMAKVFQRGLMTSMIHCGGPYKLPLHESRSWQASHFCLTDDQKRWLVAGITLNKVLVPQIRPFVEQEVEKEYNTLKSSHTIHIQTRRHYLKAWPTTSKEFLKYENINGNDGLPRVKIQGKYVYDYKSFNYQVTSHVDFARLFVQNFMAKFTAFDDHCDASAVLQLLLRIPSFSTAVLTAADKVRKTRNDWAHCVFSKCDQPNFSRSFSDMEQLVKNLALSGAGKILGDLKDWETKGTALFQNSPIDPDLLQLFQQELNFLKVSVDTMCVENEEDKTKIKNELRTIEASLEEMKKRVENLEFDVEVVKGRLDDFEGPVLERLENNQQNTDSRVDLVEGSMTVVKGELLHLQEQVQDLVKSKGSDLTIACAESPKPAGLICFFGMAKTIVDLSYRRGFKWGLTMMGLCDEFIRCLAHDVNLLSRKPSQRCRADQTRLQDAVLCPFPWCEEDLQMELSEIFTKLQIVSRKKERARLTKDIVQMTGVFNPHQQCEKPRVVLIEAPPGMGKTTYCQKLAYDWSVMDISLEASFPKVDMLLRLNCRDMKTNNIEDAIDDQLLPLDADEQEKKNFFHFMCRNQSRILLVLDGLDELPQDLFEGLLLLIRGKVFANIYLLLTARHEVGMKVRKYCDTVLEIVGFTSEDAESFIKKYFSNHDDPSLAEKLISSLDTYPKLRELSANPLNTALLCLVYEDLHGKLPHNRTVLYRELVSCVLRRYFSSMQIFLDDKSLNEECSDDLNQLGKFALDALLMDQLTFTPGELKSQSAEFFGFGFLSRVASAIKMKPKATYAFTHKTCQEYFAALHLAQELATGENDKVALLAQLSPVGKYWQVWEFVITIAATKSDDLGALVVSRLCACYQQEKPERFLLDFSKELDCNFSHDDSWDNNEEDIVGMGSHNYEEDCSSESHQDDDNVDSHNTDSDDGSDHRFDGVIANRVCEDTPHDWVECSQARWLFQYKSGVPLFELIIHTIAQCETSESELSRRQIKMAATLARCLPLEKMAVGTIGWITLTPQCIPVLLEYLKGNSQLKEFGCYESCCYELSSDAIEYVLQSCNELKRLYLFNDLSNSELTSALQRNRTVTHLKLTSIGTCLNGAEALGGILQSNHTLTHLCLADNYLTHVEVEALAQGLLSNTVLVYLDLSGNAIGDQGAVALFAALESNRMLEYLDVSFQNQSLSRPDHMESEFLGDAGTKALARALRFNKSLTYLDLQANIFSDSAPEELGEALQLNSSLTHL
ncbi:Nucleotide-binding oligomerization domain-containing protein 2 [Stylophora pistillata]|uniref:Nucleotide-binding oligomerization domain-containing protein 2 n=1 Tax=Stylophora pistillata TaxID=50429 RepID=A0A2B4SG93_STYPI|nr:Nucleotide-binding oligomerization domain-containing protein 2 [Stylophora pistillata]